MPSRIEDYALIGDLQTAALVSKDGSVDWLCVPRFDSPACFAALLGADEHGRWRVAPEDGVRSVSRRYIPSTLVLETEFRCDDGVVRLTDLMPPREEQVDVVRIVEGVSGRVRMSSRLLTAFGYGEIAPWVERTSDGMRAIGGPDAVELHSDVQLDEIRPEAVARFGISAGERARFVLTWHPSHESAPEAVEADDAAKATIAWWEEWSDRLTYEGEWREDVLRSLLTLKALTYAPTGGVVAAPTTSLPEAIGGIRNWDYRYCWVRDATFTLRALIAGGFRDEAVAWRDWLLRAVAGEPAQVQIMYGVAGERMLPEIEIPWLPGYAASRPVRIGNAAAEQFQLDVYGELMDMLHEARRAGVDPDARAWDVQTALMEFLESAWQEPDEGIWEIRSERRHYTHSKVMAWVAADRAAKAVERFGLEGDVVRWRALARDIHNDVCTHGWNQARHAFTQSYGSPELDASLLMIPIVSFLPPDDDRVIATVDAIQRELTVDGFVHRYRTEQIDDALPPGEGTFLPCTFWLVEALALLGRTEEARTIYRRLLGMTNDVGLLSEEYDPVAGRMVGNFPQALSHIALVHSAYALSRPSGGTDKRGE